MSWDPPRVLAATCCCAMASILELSSVLSLMAVRLGVAAARSKAHLNVTAITVSSYVH